MAHKKSESSAHAAPAAKRGSSTKKPRAKKPRKIDFSDIPELGDGQLRSMNRVGRPRKGSGVRQLIAIRIDPKVLKELQKEAAEAGKGYQTLINEILADYIKAS